MQRILTILVFLVSFQVQAQTQIIYGDPNVTDEDKIKIDTILRDYTGPAPRYFQKNPNAIDDPEFAMLFSDQPFAEAKFIRAKLAADFAQYQLQVQTIPTTLWDTTMARLWLTDKDWHERINASFKDAQMRQGELRAKLYFDIYAMIGGMITEKGRKNSALKEMIIENLHMIKENHFKDDKLEWSASLIKEYDKIQNGIPSMLIELVDEEYTAARNNKVLVIRATNGIPLTETAATKEIDDRYEEYIKNVKNGQKAWFRADKYTVDQLMQMKEEAIAERKAQWIYTDTEKGRVVDFPLKGEQAYKAIDYIEQLFANPSTSDAWKMDSKDLSYATSLMGGYFYDSYNRKVSASTFVFYTNGQTDIVYTLLLDKKWLFTNGKFLFHFDDLYPDAILGAQEIFHPHLRKIQSSIAMMQGHKKDVTPSQVMTDAVYNMDKDMYGQYRFRSDNNALLRDIRIYLNYVLTAAEVLTHARVIAIGKDTLKVPNESPEAQQLVQNQKRAFEVLKAHMLAGD